MDFGAGCTVISLFLGRFIFSVEMGRIGGKNCVIWGFIAVFCVYRGWYRVVGFPTAVGRWGMSYFADRFTGFIA